MADRPNDVLLTVDLFYNLNVSTSEDLERRKLLDVLENCKKSAEDGANEDPHSISEVFDAIKLAESSFALQPQLCAVPYVQIIEQPASKALRFRYPCESRSTGSIPGVSSNSLHKTYPTIQIHNYVGPVGIVVSCVTKDAPHRPHPHHLIGRGQFFNKKKGAFAIRTTITEECNVYKFVGLGIQCLKRNDMTESLRVREKLRIDPFNTGFDHKNSLNKIDMYAVRLCFQVLIPDDSGRFRQTLTPVVSNVIYDRKAMGDPVIMKTSHCSGSASGGTQVILLCDKINKDDTEVVFYLKQNNVVVWEAKANIIDVHKQVAIVLETPAFRDPLITEHVNVLFQLRKLPDGDRSNSLTFEYIPDYSDVHYKRKKVASLLRHHGNDIVMRRVHPTKLSHPEAQGYHRLV